MTQSHRLIILIVFPSLVSSPESAGQSPKWGKSTQRLKDRVLSLSHVHSLGVSVIGKGQQRQNYFVHGYKVTILDN